MDSREGLFLSGNKQNFLPRDQSSQVLDNSTFRLQGVALMEFAVF